jgi:hypothetical protein
MTISSTINRVSYVGDGVSTAFSFPYLFLANADLVVYQNAVVKTINTHYTVSGAGNPAGGTVTFLTPPANLDSIVILRNPALTQLLDLVDNDPLPANPVEQAFDLLTMLAQRSGDLISRSLRQQDPDVANIGSLPLKANRASMYLGFDANGDPIPIAAAAGGAVISPFMVTLLDDTTAAIARATLGLHEGLSTGSIFDAKGDLLVGTADNTGVRKAVGSDGLYLQTASGQSDGLLWGNPTKVFQGRLTLASGTPVPTADITGASAETIYFTPYAGDKISLYDGANWRIYAFTEISADIPDATQMNDVFIYDNAGTLTLDIVAWTNDTTRATALAVQNGVYVKSGATNRIYLGSFYATTAGNGQSEDSIAKRWVWNYYNRVIRSMRVLETTASWTYTTNAAWRQARASTANQLDFVVGVSEDAVNARVTSRMTAPDATLREWGVGIGLDSTTVDSSSHLTHTNGNSTQFAVGLAFYTATIAPGHHTLVWLEANQTGVTLTYSGQSTSTANPLQSSISGEILA